MNFLPSAGWLSKYCILNMEHVEMYKRAFDAVSIATHFLCALRMKFPYV